MPQNSVQIAPSILACDLSRLKDEILAVEVAGANLLHFDVMDGHFVPNISMGLPVIKAARGHTKLPIDAHLMISNPDNFVEAFKEVGCDYLSVHVEACTHLHRTLHRIQALQMKAGVAINPGTSLSVLDGVLDVADYVLIMSVNPGFGGQSFIPQTSDRIRELKRKLKKESTKIEVDGGIKISNIEQVVSAGADWIVVGTGLFGTKDYKKTIAELKGKF